MRRPGVVQTETYTHPSVPGVDRNAGEVGKYIASLRLGLSIAASRGRRRVWSMNTENLLSVQREVIRSRVLVWEPAFLVQILQRR